MLLIKRFGKEVCGQCQHERSGAVLAFFAGEVQEQFYCFTDLNKFLKGMHGNPVGEMVMTASAERIREMIKGNDHSTKAAIGASKRETEQ